MKKIMFLISFVFLLVGCSDKETSIEKNAKPTNSSVSVSNDQEKEELEKLLEQRPNVTSDQLRTTINQTLKIFDRMLKKDYEYLESVADDSVTIDKENDSFKFNEIEQKFIHNLDYGLLEFRGIHLEDDLITVNFAQNSIEYEFYYVLKNDEIFLNSFLTN
ncbi:MULTISPECIES: hypothetical protein [unclassified Mesobacillus]|uniref:hypothetical protein n=1 Tax=unclassified Mesobacillus TaxID=2675270 RepID=UPI00203E914A|nr:MULTISPECIES: hypothetical protein [unclassified Mesobacillus]MCM3124481.1 hypothetical protein [Mesobacillus sp. MER 33]MCM3234809.1 hypothetical protein [Mesobacillus sp. MER 48]